MSFLKQYIKNKCRICKKTFCCEKCRIDHEIRIHNIHPNCDICLYGYIYISTASDVVINHIKKSHWPLNCIFCKRLFGSMNELIEHSKCPMAPSNLDDTNLSKTPCKIVVEENFDSPPIGTSSTLFFSSTPIQVDESNNFPDTITPIDRKAKIKNANENLSTHTPCDVKKNDKKRRVTFIETPITEYQRKNIDGAYLKTTLKKCCMQQFNLKELDNLTTSCDKEEISDNKFVSAELNNIEYVDEIQDNNENEKKPAKTKKRRSSTMNETLWESAIMNDESVMYDDDNKNKRQKLCIYSEQNDCSKESSYGNCVLEGSTDVFKSDTCPALVTCQLTYMNMMETPKTQNDSQKYNGLWSSMAYLVKSVVHGFSSDVPTANVGSQKRMISECETTTEIDMESFKRIKLTKIKCRPPIRTVLTRYLPEHCNLKIDKSTQTDDIP